MKKLSKDSVKKLADASAKMTEIKDKVESLIEDTNSKMIDLIALFNDERNTAASILDDLNNEQNSYFDDRSEKWQEGDTGQAYSRWMENVARELERLSDDVVLEVEIDLSDLEACIEACDDVETEFNE